MRISSFISSFARYTKARLSLLTLAVLLVCVLPAAFAQEFRATISGKIADATGAVLPNANVTVTEMNTGTTNKTVSDAAGEYVVPFLLPGTYKIEAQASGFESVVRSSVVLQSQEHPIIDLALPAGAASETVTVTSSTPLVDQADASVGQVISTEAVEDLPLNGENADDAHDAFCGRDYDSGAADCAPL